MAYNVTAQLNLQLNPQSLNQIAQALNSITNGKSIGGNLFNANGIKDITSELNNSKNAMVQFGEQAGLAAKRFGAFTLTAGGFIQVTQGFRAMLNEAIAFDREMVKLKQVSGDTASSGVGAIREEIDRLSTGLGVSSSQLARVSVILKQANLNLGETKTALEALALSALAPNFDSMEKTAEGAIAVLKQFKIPVEELKSALGSINAVAGEFAVEASDLIGVIQRTGGAFKAAGGNLNELLALFTSVRQTTRESAESISTGLRTIFTRIQRTGTAEALREVGVNLRYTRDEALALGDVNLTSQFVGAYEAVRRLSVALNQIPATDPKFAQLVEELGGYRQISKVIPLIQEFSVSQQALNVAITGGASLMNSAAQAQGSFGNRLDKLKESYLQFGRTLLDSSSFKTLFTAFETGAQAALVLMNALKPLLPMITMLATIKMAQGVGSFGAGFFQGLMPTKKSGGGPLRFKKGGIVPGSGSGDIVPAMLEPGEMVIPKRMVKKYSFGGAHTADIDEEALNNPSGFSSYMQGSQTVNPKTGKYRKFFHGTKGQNFDNFSNAHAKNTWFGRGHYFSADAKVASRYSETDKTAGGYDPGARVMSATLQMKNPYTWNSDKSLKDFIKKGGKDLKSINGQFDQKDWDAIVQKGVLPEDISQGTLDHLNKIFTKFPSIAEKWNKAGKKGMSSESKMKFVAHGATQTLKKQGYDSVNVDYGLNRDYFNASTVFDPKQIKSLGNEGGWNSSLKEIGKNSGGSIRKFAIGGDVDESKLNNPQGFKSYMEGSKTINPLTGKYKKFFHGTKGDNFNTFNNSRTGGNFYGKAHYFTQDSDSASSYSGQDTVRNMGSRVLPTTLQMKNPYLWNPDKSIDDLVTGGELLKARNGKLDKRAWDERIEKGAFPEDISEDTLKHANKIFTRFPNIAQAFNKMDTGQQRKFFSHVASKALQKQGFDSINIGSEYSAVFKSNQIKSLYNTGKWDSKNTDVMKNLGGYIGRKRFYDGGDILEIARASGMNSIKQKFNVGLKNDYDNQNKKIKDTLQNNIEIAKTINKEKPEEVIASQLGTRASIIKKAEGMSKKYGIKINEEDLNALTSLKTKGVNWQTIIERSENENSTLSDKQKNILQELKQKNKQIKLKNEFTQFVGLKELDTNNTDNQRLNKFAGAIGEKQIKKKNPNYEKLANESGADFYIPNTKNPYEFVEVKTNMVPVSDDILRGKALLGFSEKISKNFKNQESENIPEKIKINYQQALASGGFIVPGVGDTDSVPMDLPVGSYVIKKSSTKKMGFANGGVVPALLTPGELVIDPKTASGIGQGKLDHMNRTGKTAFAKGGRVGFAWGGGSTPDMFNVGFNPLMDAGLTDQFQKMTPVMQSVVENLARLNFVFGRTATVEESYNQVITEITQLEKNREALKGMAPGTAIYTATQSIVRNKESDINNRLVEAGGVTYQDPGEKLARERAKEEINRENPSIISNLGDEVNQKIISIKVSSQRAQIEKEYLDVVQMQIKEAYPLLNAEQQGALALEMLNEARIKGTMAINASTKAVEGDKRLAAMGHSGADLIAAREAEKNKPKESIFKRIGNFITGDNDHKLTEDQRANRRSQRLMAGSIALGVANSYAGAFFENMGGTAKEAAEGKSGSYAAAKGIGGAYQGAAMGGTLAMSMGATPVVGAIVAAGTAIVSGIESYIAANKQVLEEIVNVNQEKFTALTTKMMDKQNSVNLSSLNNSINELSTSAANAADASTGILEALGLGGTFLGGRSEQKKREDTTAAIRKTQEQNSGQISSTLTKALSQQLMKGNIANKTEEEFYKLSKTIIDGSEEFKSLIMSARQVGESFDEARIRITKASAGIANLEAAKRAAENMRFIIDRSALAIKTFADNLEGSSVRVGENFKNFDNAISAFEGGNRISQSYESEKNTKVFANPSAFSSQEFKETIISTFSNFPKEVGENFAKEYAPMADITNKLPEVLAHSINAENPAKDFMDRMEILLGPEAKKDPQIQAILKSLSDKLTNKDDIKSKGANALAAEMSSSILDPIKTYGSKVNELNNQIFQSLSSSFTKLNQSTLKLIEGYEKADNLLFDTLETGAKAQHIMMGGSGDIGAKPMAVAQLQAIQQKRYLDEAAHPELLGNTTGIGEALRKAMDDLIENQKKSGKDFKGGEIERTATLADFDKKIDNFKKALEHTITGQLAVAAEFGKLAQEVGRQRNAGASLSRRLAMGGPEEQFKFMQGSRIFQGVMSGQISAGQVLNNPMLAKILDEFAQMTGEMKINGMTAQEHLNARIYEPHAQMAFGVPGRNVEANLINQEAAHKAEAAKAQMQLNEAMKKSVQEGNERLIESQNRLRIEMEKINVKYALDQEKQKAIANPEMKKKQQAVQTIEDINGMIDVEGGQQLNDNDLNFLKDDKNIQFMQKMKKMDEERKKFANVTGQVDKNAVEDPNKFARPTDFMEKVEAGPGGAWNPFNYSNAVLENIGLDPTSAVSKRPRADNRNIQQKDWGELFTEKIRKDQLDGLVLRNLVTNIKTKLGNQFSEEDIRKYIHEAYDKGISLGELFKQKKEESEKKYNVDAGSRLGVQALPLMNRLSSSESFNENFSQNLTSLSEAAKNLGTESFANVAKSVDEFKQTLDQSNKKIKELTTTLENLEQTREQEKNKKIQEQAQQQQQQQNGADKKANGGLIKPFGFSKGGVVPGHGNRDTVPAMLTPGEIVLPKRFQEGGPVDANELIYDENGKPIRFKYEQNPEFQGPLTVEQENAELQKRFKISREEFRTKFPNGIQDNQKFKQTFGIDKKDLTTRDARIIASYYGSDAIYENRNILGVDVTPDEQDKWDRGKNINFADKIKNNQESKDDIAKRIENKYGYYLHPDVFDDIFNEKRGSITTAQFERRFGSNLTPEQKMEIYDAYGPYAVPRNEENISEGTFNEKPSLKVQQKKYEKDRQTRLRLGNNEELIDGRWYKTEDEPGASPYVGAHKNEMQPSLYQERNINKYGPGSKGRDPIDTARKEGLQPNLYDQRNKDIERIEIDTNDKRKWTKEAEKEAINRQYQRRIDYFAGRENIPTIYHAPSAVEREEEQKKAAKRVQENFFVGHENHPMINQPNTLEQKAWNQKTEEEKQKEIERWKKNKPKANIFTDNKKTIGPSSNYRRSPHDITPQSFYQNRATKDAAQFLNNNQNQLGFNEQNKDLNGLRINRNNLYNDLYKNIQNPQQYIYLQKMQFSEELAIQNAINQRSLKDLDKNARQTMLKKMQAIQIIRNNLLNNPRYIKTDEELQELRNQINLNFEGQLYQQNASTKINPEELIWPKPEIANPNIQKPPQNNPQPEIANPNIQKPPMGPPAAPPIDLAPNSHAAYQEYKDWFKNTFGMDHSVWVRKNWPGGKFQEPTIEDQEWRHYTFIQNMKLIAQNEKRELTDDESRVIPLHREGASKLLAIIKAQKAQNKMNGGLIKPSYYEEGGAVRKPSAAQLREQEALHHAMQKERGNNPFAITPLIANDKSMNLQLPSRSGFKPENKSQQIPKNNNSFEMGLDLNFAKAFGSNNFFSNAIYRANGGSIFKPQGTDTVPAMLTPGEFVMRKSAVDKIGATKLSQMNHSASYFAGGGMVNSNTSLDQSTSFNQVAASFNGFINSFNISVDTFNNSVESFGEKVQQFSQAVSVMPATLTVNGQVGANVTTNAAGIITQISNVVQNMISSEIKKALSNNVSLDQRSRPS